MDYKALGGVFEEIHSYHFNNPLTAGTRVESVYNNNTAYLNKVSANSYNA